jgi:hypothetical protein
MVKLSWIGTLALALALVAAPLVSGADLAQAQTNTTLNATTTGTSTTGTTGTTGSTNTTGGTVGLPNTGAGGAAAETWGWILSALVLIGALPLFAWSKRRIA